MKFWIYSPIIVATVLYLILVYAGYNFRKISYPFKVTFVILIFYAIIDIALGVCTDKYGSNYFILPISFFVEYVLYLYLYLYAFKLTKSKIVTVGAYIVLVVILFEACYVTFFTEVKNFNSYGKVLSNGTVMVFSMIYFFRALANLKQKLNQNILLYNSVILIYSAVGMFVFGSVNFLINENVDIVIYFWTLNTIVVFLFYIAIAYLIYVDINRIRIKKTIL